MNWTHRSETSGLAGRLRVDAQRLDEGPSPEARARLRNALAAAPARERTAPRPARIGLRRASIGGLAAAAALLLFAYVSGPDDGRAHVESDADVRVAMRAILEPLLATRTTVAREAIAERPLRGEIDALVSDAVSLRDAVIRRIPAPLVPKRSR